MTGIYPYETKKGTKYRIQYYVKDPVTGENISISKRGFIKKKDAEKYLTEKIYEIEKGLYIADNGITLGDYLDEWFELHVTGRNLRSTTAEGYKRNIRHIKENIGNIKLQKLRGVHIQRFYAEQLKNGRFDGKGGLSAKTIQYIHRVLSRALKDAVTRQLIPRNVAQDVSLPKIKKYKATVYDKEDLSQLLLAVKGTEIELPVVLSISLGLRRGEVLGLTWGQIDFEKKQVTIDRQLIKPEQGTVDTKTEDSVRVLPLPDSLAELLKEHRMKKGIISMDPDQFVNTKENGEPFNPSKFSKIFAKFLKDNNLKKIRFHDLRHSYATFGLASGAPMKVVSELLGHSSIQITADLYGHVLDDVKRDASNHIFNSIFDTDFNDKIRE